MTNAQNIATPQAKRRANPHRLNDETVETWPAEAKRRELPDHKIGGLYLIIQPGGSKSWAYRYRIKGGGGSRKLTLGSYPQLDLAAARAAAKVAIAAIANGHDPALEKVASRGAAKAPPADADLVENIAARFLREYVQRRLKAEQLRPSSAHEAERILAKEIVPLWRGRRLKDIERSDVRELLSGVAERAPVMSNRVFAALSKLFNWAISQDILDKNPTVGVERAAEKSRERWLTDDELPRVWKTASAVGTYGKIVQFLILSGQRRGEVAGMKWSEVDFEKRAWTLPAKRAKNAVLHVVPLTDSMTALIKSMPRIDGNPYVFATSGNSIFQHWDYEKDRLIAAMGDDSFEDWTLHDLRRTFATGLAQKRVDLVVVEKLLNHVSGSLRGVAGIYQRYGFDDEKREALERWERHVLELVGEDGGGKSNVVDIAEARHGAA